jgi:ATP synthase protein I
MRKPEPETPVKGEAVQGGRAGGDDLRSRLDALKADLGEAIASEQAEAQSKRSQEKSGGALGIGMRAGSELMAGVLVGCGVGYVLDRQFEVSPLFLIIFMMVGTAAGFWNIYRLGLRGSNRQGK